MNRPEQATNADAAEVLALYRAAAAAANQSGHSHWDEDYPLSLIHISIRKVLFISFFHLIVPSGRYSSLTRANARRLHCRDHLTTLFEAA